MQKMLQAEIKRTIRKNRQHKAWVRVVSILAGIVVFCTTYALILPAITLEKPPDEVGELIERIDALPTPEEIGEALTAYEESGDESGYAEYYSEVQHRVWFAWLMYEEYALGQGYDIPNKDRLLALEWMLVDTLATDATRDSAPVYGMNQYNSAGKTVLVYCNGSTVSGRSGSGFPYWKAYVVEKEPATGLLKVVSIDANTNNKNKGGLTASSDGFVLFVHGADAGDVFSAKVGDYLTVDFNFKTTNKGNKTYFGTVSVIESKANKNNEIEELAGVDTHEFIDINLYNYGDNINDPWKKENNEYPRFQKEGLGSPNGWTKLTNGTFNFGALAVDIPGDSGREGAINKVPTATTPLKGAVDPLLKNGYPQLTNPAGNGISLQYLFSQSDYANKQNRKNVDGLFQYDPELQKYYYHSSENHAQFDSEKDRFVLYNAGLTPNAMMYAFGNFLPFNDITNLSKKSSEIDGKYLASVALSAANKAKKSGISTNDKNNYNNLSAALTKFIELMNKEHPDWDALTATNTFLGLNNESWRVQKKDLDKLYTLDYDEKTDFYFGMEMKMNFMQAKGGKVGKNNDQDMIFKFSGDDDILVYIDGVLFLDLSGIHRQVGGEINFATGKVTYYGYNNATGKADKGTTGYNTDFKTLLTAANKDTSVLNENGTFKDYSKHVFNFYFVERGAGSSLCNIEFNFPLLKKNIVSVSKELEIKQEDQGKLELLGNPDFEFQLLMAENDGRKTNISMVSENFSYDIYEGETLIGHGTVGKGGIFTLKAGQRAEFSITEDILRSEHRWYFARELLDPNMFEQFGLVRANGSVVLENEISHTTINEKTFNGVDSAVERLEDGLHTQFAFVNQVDFNKLGALKITKNLEALSPVLPDQTFNFTVTFDGVPIPIGTKYRLTKADGTQTARSIESPGSLSLPPGATAVFSGVIAGTRFEIRETSQSAKGYTVTYAGDDGVTTDGTSAAGVILAKTESGSTDGIVRVTVTNSEQGTSLELPVYKTITNPDGAAHTYWFKLEEIMSAEDHTPKENGFVQQLELTVINSADGIFDLPYPASVYLNPETKLYYKITEHSDAADRSTSFDQGVYIAEVTVTRTGGALSASLTGLWKDGTASESISFTNVLLKELTLSKEIVGVTPGGQEEFAFEIELKDHGGIPVNGALSAVRMADGEVALEELIQFTDGKAEIRLKVSQTLTVYGIPNGAAWTIREITTDGYRVSWVIDGMTSDQSNTASGTLNGSVLIKCINTTSYELPATGGSGTDNYITGGLVLWMSAGILLYIKYKRGRRSTVPPDL